MDWIPWPHIRPNAIAARCASNSRRSARSPPRACQCGFCRKHNARTVTDPEGSTVITLVGEPIRYRFGSGATDFLICGRCGVYVGATAEIDGQSYATLNLNAFDNPRPDLEGMPVSYDGEDAAAKRERRRAKWAPARLA